MVEANLRFKMELRLGARVLIAIMLVIVCAIGRTESSTAANQSKTVRPSSLLTTTTTATSSSVSESETTTFSPPPTRGSESPDDEEPMTSTLDSLTVNSDESSGASIIVEDGADESTGALVGGIEAKSVSTDAADNALGADGNAKLVSIDAGQEETITPSTTPTASEPVSGGQFKKPQSKLNLPAHINMTQVDVNYTSATKDQQEIVESWQKMSRKLKKGISGIIGQVVPMGLNMFAEVKMSSNCSGAMLKWVLNMSQLRSWALRMLDASGKPAAGLLEGAMTMFGNYRECLKIRAPDDDEIDFHNGQFREYFRGKYCVIQAKPWLPEKSRFYSLNTKLAALTERTEDEEPTPWWDQTIFDELSEWALAFNFVNIRYDLCVPSLCKREDIQKIINYLLLDVDLKARVLRCESDALPGTSPFAAAHVETSSEEVTGALVAASTDPNGRGPTFGESFSQLGWMLLPLLATLIVLLATAASMALKDEHDDDDRSKLTRTIKSVSLKRSVSSHLNVDYDQLADDKPLALYGVRFILVLWVILVESTVNLKFDYLRELLMLKDFIFWWPLQFIINSTLQFDSLIILTAFTMGYKNCLNEGAHQAKAITRYVLDKYIRLMPSVMVMVAMVIVLPLVYRGPVWNDVVAKQSSVCQSTGWLNSVFLQNYLPFQEICLPQTWLLCVELQLVLLMAPIIYYLNEKYTRNYYGGIETNRRISLAQLAKKFQGHKVEAESCSIPLASRPFFWLKTLPGLALVVCMIFGLAASFYNVYRNQLPPSWYYTMADPDSKALYFGEHLTKIWTHLAVFAVGIIAGVECRRASRNSVRNYRGHNLSLLGVNGAQLGGQHKDFSLSSSSLPVMLNQSGAGQDAASSKTPSEELTSSTMSIHINTNTSSSSNENIDIECASNVGQTPGRSCCSTLRNTLGCLLAVGIMGALLFSTHDWSLNDLPEPLTAATYDATSRFSWSIAFVWILYMVCVPDKNRNFGPVAQLLGHPFVVSLGKLSFLAYLIHPFVHITMLAIQEQPIYSSWLMLFHILIGNVTITMILSSLVSLFVEMPCRNLFRRCGTSIIFSQAPSTLTTASPASSSS